jgi:predicted alpha/beta superfamily hydrolase
MIRWISNLGRNVARRIETQIPMTSWQEYATQGRSSYHTVTGNLQVWERLWSPQLHNQRDILVLLPPSYEEDERRYPVLYMHDGQNLFDQVTSFAGEWRVDEAMQALSREGLEAIVVGVPNVGVQRLAEYSPFRDVYHGIGRGARYLDFLVETVKTKIDADFRTLSDQPHTGIMGSSMGGLISLYGFFSYPDVFGFVGAMSPSLWYAQRAIFPFVREAPYVPGRIYMDVGTREYGGDKGEAAALRRSRRHYSAVRRMKRILVDKGYRQQHDLLVVEEKWAGHNEPAWSRRLPRALRFLLPVPGQDGAGR